MVTYTNETFSRYLLSDTGGTQTYFSIYNRHRYFYISVSKVQRRWISLVTGKTYKGQTQFNCNSF